MSADLGWGRIALRVGGAAAFVAALSFAPLHSLPQPRLFAPKVGATTSHPSPRPLPSIDDVATLLPDDVLIAAEARGLGDVARGWLEGGLYRRLVACRSWRRFERSPEHAQLLAGLGFVELVSGMKPAELFGALLGDELAAGVVLDGALPGGVVVVRTVDADVAEHVVNVARGLALANKEAPVPVATIEHAGVSGLVLQQKLWLAAIERVVVAASSERLFTNAIDRALTPTSATAPPRTVPPLVASIRAKSAQGSLVSFGVDVKKIAATRPDGRLLPARADNSVGGMLFGDLFELASRAEIVCGDVSASGDALAVHLRVPGDPAKLPPCFRSFGHASASTPLLALAPQETMLTLSLRRDWAHYWEDRVELCDPKTEKEFADLKTNLGLFFGGKSLPDDVLPKLDDEILFVVSRQTFSGIAAPPKVRYPAFAFVWRAKGDVAKVGRDFAIGVQSFIGIINVERAQQNQTPFLPFTEPFEGVTVYGGRSLTDDDRPADPGRYNFSPCAAWVGDRILLASSEELLHGLVRELKQPIASAAAPGRSGLTSAGRLSYLRVDGAALAELVRDDHDALVTNAMLNEGKTKERAEFESDFLAELCAMLAQARIESILDREGMTLALNVELAPFVAAPAASSKEGGP